MPKLANDDPSFDNDSWRLIADLWPDLRSRATDSARAWCPAPEPCSAFLSFARERSADLQRFEATQPFRPYYRALGDAGVGLTPEARGTYDFTFVVATRQRNESLGWIARALHALTPNGVFVFASANDQGAAGFLKRLREVAPDLVAESGRKCRRVMLTRQDLRHPAVLDAWLAEAGAQSLAGVANETFVTVPGIYGWNKIDTGSRLLVEHLPPLSGRGLDLGAGYGFLSQAALAKSAATITHLDLVEAELRALDCARKNLSAWSDRCEFHWLDVSAETKALALLPPVDWVVMNPPFHHGRGTEISLGERFIEAAAARLKPGGALYLVANSFLAYEAKLTDRFRRHTRVAERDGFKVIHAVV